MSSLPASDFTAGISSGEPTVTVGYATDIEGNFDYWSKYIEISKILHRLPSGVIELSDDCHFVYGGDVVDRGPGDLRVISDLIGMKRSYPERVHFIMGNRDINKMRIPAELHHSSLQFPPKVYWIKGDIELQDLERIDTKTERLKWVKITFYIFLLSYKLYYFFYTNERFDVISYN